MFQDVGTPNYANILNKYVKHYTNDCSSSYAKYFNNCGVKKEGPAALCNLSYFIAVATTSIVNKGVDDKLCAMVS